MDDPRPTGHEAAKPAPVRPATGSLPGETSTRPVASTRAGGWRWLVVALAVVLLAGGGWWFWSARTAKNAAAQTNRPAPAVPVEAAAAERMDLPLYLFGLGNVQPFNAVTVRSRVDGEIMRIAFQEGQMVKEGDVLIEIDPRPYRAALEQAVARKKQDEATIANTRRDLERLSGLGEFASRQQVDTQRAQVGSQSAQIAADQAAIDAAQTQLDYATIRAPISGRLGLRLVDQGNIVRATDQTGIVQIAQLQPISVILTAPQAQLPELQAALAAGPVEVTASTPAGGTVLDTGKLALINNEVDLASGTVRLKAVFDNAQNRLWPGLSVNTRLTIATLKGVTAVSDNAIQRGQDELFVFVVKDGKAEKRVVQVGPFTEGRAVVEKGLAPGETIVTAGQSRLQDGTRIEVRQPQGAAPSAVQATNTPATVTR